MREREGEGGEGREGEGGEIERASLRLLSGAPLQLIRGHKKVNTATLKGSYCNVPSTVEVLGCTTLKLLLKYSRTVVEIPQKLQKRRISTAPTHTAW